MLRKLTVLVFFLLILPLLSACSKSEAPTQHVELGKFVVESYSIACSIKVNQTIDTLRSFLSYSLKYHFESQPGDVEWVEVTPHGLIGVLEHIYNVVPESVGITNTIAWGFWIGDSLNGVDSITVNTWVAGSFWGPDSGTYEWRDQRTVPITR